MLSLQSMVCDQNKVVRQHRSALPGKHILRESEIKAVEAENKRKAIQRLYIPARLHCCPWEIWAQL